MSKPSEGKTVILEADVVELKIKLYPPRTIRITGEGSKGKTAIRGLLINHNEKIQLQ